MSSQPIKITAEMCHSLLPHTLAVRTKESNPSCKSNPRLAYAKARTDSSYSPTAILGEEDMEYQPSPVASFSHEDSRGVPEGTSPVPSVSVMESVEFYEEPMPEHWQRGSVPLDSTPRSVTVGGDRDSGASGQRTEADVSTYEVEQAQHAFNQVKNFMDRLYEMQLARRGLEADLEIERKMRMEADQELRIARRELEVIGFTVGQMRAATAKALSPRPRSRDSPSRKSLGAV